MCNSSLQWNWMGFRKNSKISCNVKAHNVSHNNPIKCSTKWTTNQLECFNYTWTISIARIAGVCPIRFELRLEKWNEIHSMNFHTFDTSSFRPTLMATAYIQISFNCRILSEVYRKSIQHAILCAPSVYGIKLPKKIITEQNLRFCMIDWREQEVCGNGLLIALIRCCCCCFLHRIAIMDFTKRENENHTDQDLYHLWLANSVHFSTSIELSVDFLLHGHIDTHAFKMICWPIDIVWIIGFTFQSMFSVCNYVCWWPLLYRSLFWQNLLKQKIRTRSWPSSWLMCLHPFWTKSEQLFRIVCSFWLSFEFRTKYTETQIRTRWW